MQLSISPKDVRDAYETPIVQQTTFWSLVKRHLGMRSRAFEFSVRNSDIYEGVGGLCRTNADFIVFQQKVGSGQYIAYLPYGPEVEPSQSAQGRFLEELSELLRHYLEPGCIALRYDLNWLSHWCTPSDYDEAGNWKGLPAKEFQEMRLNFDTVNWNLRKTNINVLPADTVVVDLTVPEEEILARMKPKTRYNIRLSHRRGVEVRELGMKGLGIWWKLYTQTAERNGLHVSDLSCFRSILASKMECEDEDINARLLCAYLDGEPLAAVFLVKSAYRATYLYGASSSSHRDAMPAYALQWEAIRRAKAAGCIEYDMFGVAPNDDPAHPMHGLYRFKKGFGGSMLHQLGCWDYPLDAKAYACFAAREMSAAGYYR
jgi:lipid II:glycine glycyltransferase (peptidoglycan interpeptide bridge formation enzyme)